MKTLLNALKYKKHGWAVTGYYKMVAFLIGLQGNFTKFPCYLYCSGSGFLGQENYVELVEAVVKSFSENGLQSVIESTYP